MSRKPSIGVHGMWIIAILAVLVVSLVSVKAGPVDNLATILSFGVGLSSLILSILAIIQNFSMGPSLAAVTTAGASVQTAGERLERVTSELSRRISSIDEVPKGLERLQATVDQLNSTQSSLEVNPELPLEPLGGLVDFEKLSAVTTAGGTIVWYALARALDAGRPFDFNDVFDVTISGYYNGYISGLRGSFFIDYDIDDDGRYLIKDLAKVRQGDAYRLIDEFAMTSDDKLARELLSTSKAKIDKFFNSPAPK
ncbi:MAG: hypothetical protein JSR86_14745 [Proteobacteria bacterium]|nr:hypothetical protein [Pseudomonadota bacterium]